MKLVLQLQKSDEDGFLTCLHWMYLNHFRTLLKNIEYLRWSDLLSLVHIAISGQISSLSDHLGSLGKVKHVTQSRDETKARRAAQKAKQSARLDEMLENDHKFAILHRSVVRQFERGTNNLVNPLVILAVNQIVYYSLFIALQRDFRVLKQGADLLSISDTSIWAPTINGSVDVYTKIGKCVPW